MTMQFVRENGIEDVFQCDVCGAFQRIPKGCDCADCQWGCDDTYDAYADCETAEEVEEGLQELVRKGYLKKTKKGYIDSDRVTIMLNEGKTRKQISQILDKEVKPNSPHK
jgi:hypothetical protein